MNKKLLYPAALLFVFVFALAIRLYQIDALPIYADEAGHYSLFYKILDTKVGLLPWLRNILRWGTFSFTWIFGLTPLGVRSAAALYGALLSVAVYFFSISLSRNKNVALITSILTAILPWSYMISRTAQTAIPIILVLISFHIYFFIKAAKIKHYLISLIFLGLATIYYPSMVILTPIAASLIFYYLVKHLSKYQLRFLILFIVPVILIGTVYMISRYRLLNLESRGPDLAIWRDINTTFDTDHYRALSWNSSPSFFSFGQPPEQLANKLFFNRISANISIFTKNYLSFFSPEWLFLKGDAILRHSTGRVGTFYPFLLPFMVYGAYKFFQTKNKKAKLTFLIWVLVSPIPAALTKDGAGYLLRVSTMLPFLTYFCALGLIESFRLISKKLRPSFILIIFLIGVYSAWYFFYSYFHVYPVTSARSYEYGFKELSDFQVSHNNASTLVIWDGYYHNLDFRFWQNTPFEQYQSFKLKRLEVGESVFWQTFTNLYFSAPKSVEDFKIFVVQYNPSYVVLPDRYFVKYPVEIEKLLKPIKEIKYPDQTTALSIYTVK